MTATAFLLLALATVACLVDWAAVASGSRVVEYIAKPLATLLLLAAAATLHVSDAGVRDGVAITLAFSLVGDIALVLPGNGGFVWGLAAFFVAHIAYTVAFWIGGISIDALLAGLVVVAVGLLVLGRRVLAGVERTQPDLLAPVGAYVGVISLMVASAIATTNPLFVVAAVVFYASDLLIAWNRFLSPLRHGPVAIMVTYHLAQFGFVLGLLAV